MASLKQTANVLLIAVPLLALSCITYVFIHNRYVHPLGRLSRQVVVGNSCNVVADVFQQYVRTESISPQVHYSDHMLTQDLRFTRDIPPSRGLALYDVSAFDDLQLRVRCSQEGRVAEKVFISD